MRKTTRKALCAGDVFGRFTVLGPTEPRIKPNGKKTYRVLARCSCGTEKVVYEEKLRSGHTRSCGCLQVEASLKNLPGPRHGMARTDFPTVLLRIECAATNPPKPLGVGVFVDRRPIAILELLELRNAFRRLEELEAAYFEPKTYHDQGVRLPFKTCT